MTEAVISCSLASDRRSSAVSRPSPTIKLSPQENEENRARKQGPNLTDDVHHSMSAVLHALFEFKRLLSPPRLLLSPFRPLYSWAGCGMSKISRSLPYLWIWKTICPPTTSPAPACARPPRRPLLLRRTAKRPFYGLAVPLRWRREGGRPAVLVRRNFSRDSLCCTRKKAFS